MNAIAKIIFLVVILMEAMRSAAMAQVGDQKACANAPDTASGQTLSDKLGQSGGVICPPGNVDPAMKKPTPPTADKPAIPPPGSSGNNPSVQPK